MKKEFAQSVLEIGTADPKVVFMTGDLGFNAFEEIIPALGTRFVNAGVAEQSMVSIAAGMASRGLQPWIYSIAPFMVLKTVEQIRNDVCHMNLPVKLVGNGGGFGYGIMGATHHLLEDLGILAAMPHMKLYIPSFSEDVPAMAKLMYGNGAPSYLRLGYAPKHTLTLPKYAAVRKLMEGTKATVVVVGPLVHQFLSAHADMTVRHGEKIRTDVDLWNISELPFTLPKAFFESVRNTQSVIIYEEHTKRSGVGEKILSQLAHKGIGVPRVMHFSAEGYPSKRYGDQLFHLKEHGLDATSMISHIEALL
jgi:transketolase